MGHVTNYRASVTTNAARPFVCRSCGLSTYAVASGSGEWTHGAAGWGHSGAVAQHHQAEAAATARALATHRADLLIRLTCCPRCGQRDRGNVVAHAVSTSFWTMLFAGGGAVALYVAYLRLFVRTGATVAGLFMCFLAFLGGYLAQHMLLPALRSYREAPGAVRFEAGGKRADKKKRKERTDPLERRERARARRDRRRDAAED